LSAAEVASGWRLLCQAKAAGEVTLNVGQWQASILADDASGVGGGHGLGIAIDLGTTTLAAQLVDQASGAVMGVATGLNPQGRHGADVMSRVQFACREGGAAVLRDLIRGELGQMCANLRAQAGGQPIAQVAIVGNTAMHHLFCGIDPSPLAAVPFHPVNDGEQVFGDADLGWDLGGARVRFLACLGGFVGSDILAGILATGMHRSEQLEVLVDLGTNGEIVVGNRYGMLCAATAAGPAFEGANISIGMRAATGAISSASCDGDGLHLGVIGGGAPRGICGSGLVDVVACALEQGRILPGGRLAGGAKTLPLTPELALAAGDVRQLQLAKGAVAAGIDLLLRRFGKTSADVARMHLAGAFGNYIVRANAERIGLLAFRADQVSAAGNTALLGAKLALGEPDDDHTAIRRQVTHVGLHEDPAFEDAYVDAMGFPAAH
jgi:uncharacterized 2Fe-2S/4Fe-4S cluster protein (DUF4445 family)